MNDSWLLDEYLTDDFFEDIPCKNEGDDWISKLETLELPPVNELFGLSEIALPCKKPLKRDPCSVPVHKGFHLQSEFREEKHSNIFQKTSPDSVLENPNSCFAENTEPNHKFDVPAKRVRNKGLRRPRPNLNVFYIATLEKSSIGVKKKRKKEQHIFTQPPLVTKKPVASARKCMHCKITHTPQWREGPLGPKTLCNACWMRIRSGHQETHPPLVAQEPVASTRKCTHCKITHTPHRREGPLGRKTLCNACWMRIRSGHQETQPPLVAKEPVASTRKCTHCKITHTPQWREGPLGPKSLCNACGMRFRSGRLLPEYRPAASPTFVPSVHSNSHRKVIEMRTKSESVVVTRESTTP